VPIDDELYFEICPDGMTYSKDENEWKFVHNSPEFKRAFHIMEKNLVLTDDCWLKQTKNGLPVWQEVENMKDDLFSILSDCAADDELDRAQQKLNDNELNDWGEEGFWNID
jgi:hypothetical protein